MPFPTGDGVLISLDKAFEQMESRAVGIKSRAQRTHDTAAAGSLTGRDVVLYFNQLGQDLDQINGWIANIDAAAANTYARDRYDDATLTVSTEFVNMRAAIDSVLTWMSVNVPTNNIIDQFNLTTRRVDYVGYTVGQTNSFRTELLALIATID